jgi:hypothetical protein
MKTKTMLDRLSATIERVVKDLRGGDVPQRKRMTLDGFMSHALAELAKAAKDKPAIAKRRLTVLKRSVDEVLTAIAKLGPEDTDSEHVDIEVTTAFAPTAAEGDRPMEELTTASDQSSSETSPLAVGGEADSGDDVTKALDKAKKALGKAPTKKATRDSWPLDLNTTAFREGVEKAEAAPAWGHDPEEVERTKAG